jgi:P pilus assembly chaperone PapD
MKKITTALISALIVLSLSMAAFALSLNIDPSNIKVTLKQGESKSGTILVRNTGGSPLKVKSYAEDWVYAKDGSKTFMKPGSSVYSCSNWITLMPQTVEIAPGRDSILKYTITAPKTSSGGHVSVIFVEGLIEKRPGIAVSGRLGTIVYQDTEGDIRRSADITDMKVTAPNETSPVEVKFTVKNNGNTYAILKGTLKITKDDKTLAEQAIPQVSTLPGDNSEVKIKASDKLAEGRYKAMVELKYGDTTIKKDLEFDIKK